MTEWIEERAEEHRQKRSAKPYTNAEIELYEMRYDEEQPRDLQKFSSTIKKERQQGRKNLIELLQEMLKSPRYKKRQDLVEMLQYYQMHARPNHGRK